jgi:hypothetical protein
MSVTLAQAYSATRQVALYGEMVSDITASRDMVPGFIERGLPRFALIRAFAIGKMCRELPMKTIFAVPGEGQRLDESDGCGRKDEVRWHLLSTDDTVAVAMEAGNILDVLSDVETRGIDGGLQIENPRFENGQLCATVHAWAEIKIFGKKIGFDERIPVCIPLQGCYPIWSIEIAKIEACFRAPSDICVRLCVGKWGLEKCWDACVHIPLALPMRAPSDGLANCACKPAA